MSRLWSNKWLYVGCMLAACAVAVSAMPRKKNVIGTPNTLLSS